MQVASFVAFFPLLLRAYPRLSLSLSRPVPLISKYRYRGRGAYEIETERNRGERERERTAIMDTSAGPSRSADFICGISRSVPSCVGG